MLSLFVYERIRGYNRFMQHIPDITDHPKRQEIENRLKIIEFFERFGPAATKEAFKKSRSTIYQWKKKILPRTDKDTHTNPYYASHYDLDEEVIYNFDSMEL